MNGRDKSSGDTLQEAGGRMGGMYGPNLAVTLPLYPSEASERHLYMWLMGGRGVGGVVNWGSVGEDAA